MAVAMVVAGFWGTKKDWLIWIGMLVGFALFAELRARMGPGVEARPLFLYVIQLETLGGLWGVPSIWLQALFQDSLLNAWGVLDAVSTTIYLSFFFVPQFVIVYLWWRGGPFSRYVAAACLLFAGALVVHFLLPTAPPWMAAGDGLIPPVERIGIKVLNSVSQTLTEGGYQASANDVAAMPSVHQGLTVLAAIALAKYSHKTILAGWVYAGLMLFSITYLGEHYAVDGVVGAGMAWGAWVLAGRWHRGEVEMEASPTHQPPRTPPDQVGTEPRP
jgi:membrane-associated phospholipid phosphatase